MKKGTAHLGDSIAVMTEAFETAQELVAQLELASRWTPQRSWGCPWVFRGQRDAEWGLTPAAWREGTSPALLRLKHLRDEFCEESAAQIRLKLDQVGRKTDPEFAVKACAQASAEFALILDFVKFADELGHSVPELETYERLAKYKWVNQIGHIGNPIRFLPDPGPAAALAQHHGVPTRLLDWTRNPLYAAYFAANEVDPYDDARALAVWAIRPDHLRDRGSAAHHNDSYTRFLDFTVPNSYNKYLHAQEGLFIHPTYGCARYVETGHYPSLEAFALAVQEEVGEPTIQKLTLPHSEVGELLRLLWLKGISRAHLMPTLDNVTQALCSRWKWDEASL